jgi:16S rRNA (guanine1516-N2)-methyltransferase
MDEARLRHTADHGSARLAGVYAADPERASAAAALADRLGTPLLPEMPSRGLVLRTTADGLELVDRRSGAPGAVRADFAPLARRRAASLRGEAVARAVGLKGGQEATVIDATAGLGKDAFVLARLGARVHLIERSPVVAALLSDALARARQDPALAPVAARMTLHQGDALALLPPLSGEIAPDAIYLDPMYPEGGTKAQVKKDMQLLRTLLGATAEIQPLFEAALACARRRVVVKRPRRSPPLPGRRPGHAIEGRSTRFDVYPV